MRALNKCLSALSIGISVSSFAARAETWSTNLPPQEVLSRLAKLYRRYHLPIPPRHSTLIWFPEDHSIGFALDTAPVNSKSIVLVGTETRRIKGESLPHNFDFSTASFDTHFMADPPAYFWLNTPLVVAIQCKILGLDQAAGAIFARSDQGMSEFPYYSNITWKEALGITAWGHWCNELTRTNLSRKVIARYMDELLQSEPRLQIAWNWSLIDSLRATIVTPRAKPGTLDALVDDLMELQTIPWRDAARTSPYAVLEDMGFAAIPTLIAHLEDSRLTRNVIGLNGNPMPKHQRVGEMATWLLTDLRSTGISFTNQAEAMLWWQDIQKQGEEQYLLKNLIHEGKETYVHWRSLTVIASRYPHLLPEIYRTILYQRPEIASHDVASKIVQSSLSVEEKSALFSEAFTRASGNNRFLALFHLLKVNRERSIVEVQRAIKETPPKGTTPYYDCAEARLITFVLMVKDPRTWQSMVEFAKQAEIGLRMEFVGRVGYNPWRTKDIRAQLDFLAAFLGDSAVRDKESDPAMYVGACAGWEFKTIEVRNLAALGIGRLLDLADKPEPKWTADQWSAFRQKIQQSLREQNIDLK